MADENKEKKLSQEEAKTASAAKRFLRQISITIKNYRMFGEHHPVLTNSVRNSYELLKNILLARETATFTFIEESCLIEEIPLKGMDPKAYSFMGVAKECGITSLTFLREVTEPEFADILKLISSGPKAIKEENGLADFIQRKDITHIKADEIFFKKVTKKEEESREAEKQLEDFLVINYFLGKGSISKDDVDLVIGTAMENPKSIGKAISRIAKAQLPLQAGGPHADGVETARAGIEKIATHIYTTHGKSYDEIKNNMAGLIMSLEPSVQKELLKKKIMVGNHPGDLAMDIIKGLADEAVVEFIVSDFVEDRSSVVETKRLIERFLPDLAKRKKALSLIESKLIQRGVARETISRMIEEKFWSDMDSSEKAKKVMEEGPSFSVEIGIADELAALVKDLLVEKNFTAVNNVVNKILENLGTKSPDIRAQVMRDFENIFALLFQSKNYPYKEILLKALGEEFKKAKDFEIKNRISNMFINSINSAAGNGSYADIAPLVNALGYKNIKERAFARTTLEQILKDMLFKEKACKDALLDLTRAAGEDAEVVLTNMLISIEPDDFDSYRKRYEIARILKEVGRDKDAEDIFIKDLSSEKLEVIKNSLEALGEIGGDKALPYIEKFLNHNNEKLREHARLAIRNIKKR